MPFLRFSWIDHRWKDLPNAPSLAPQTQRLKWCFKKNDGTWISDQSIMCSKNTKKRTRECSIDCPSKHKASTSCATPHPVRQEAGYMRANENGGKSLVAAAGSNGKGNRNKKLKQNKAVSLDYWYIVYRNRQNYYVDKTKQTKAKPNKNSEENTRARRSTKRRLQQEA